MKAGGTAGGRRHTRRKIWERLLKVDRVCAQCGAEYTATRRDSRFCGAKCRKASALRVPPVRRDAPVVALPGPVEQETRRLLLVYGRDPADDVVAMSAVRCAQAFEDSSTPPGALAGLSRTLQETVRSLRPPPDDPEPPQNPRSQPWPDNHRRKHVHQAHQG
jgi:hypothetical protein